MRKTLKYASIFLGAIILLVILAITLLVIFVNPNQFKPVITEQVEKYTGHKLVLNGNLSWKFFPTLGITIPAVSLRDAKLTTNVTKLAVSASLLPLPKQSSADFSTSADAVQVIEQKTKLALTNISAKAHFANGVLNIAPIKADFYQGNITGQAAIKFFGTQMDVQAKLANVQTQPLLEDVAGKEKKIKIAGLANVALQIRTAGTNANTLTKNLNGTGQFDLKDGAIIGVDLGYLVDSAYSMWRGGDAPQNTGKTNFGKLTGTVTIHNGVISNNDLLADTPRFEIHGSGTINLVNKSLDYTLQIAVKQRADKKDNLMNLYGITLPVTIKGDINDPTIRLNSAAIMKAVAQQKLHNVSDQTKQKVIDEIKQKLPGKAGDILNNFLGR